MAIQEGFHECRFEPIPQITDPLLGKVLEKLDGDATKPDAWEFFDVALSAETPVPNWGLGFLLPEDLADAPSGVDLFEEASEGEFYNTPVSETPFWAIRNEEGEGYRGLTFPEFQQAKEIDVFVNS